MAVPGTTGSHYEKLAEKMQALVSSSSADPMKTTVEALREWCGPIPAKAMEECDACVMGQHECSCGDTHDCGVCEGTGKVESYPDPRHGVILGLVFDTGRLAFALQPFAGDCCISIIPGGGEKSDKKILRAAGDGWVALLVQMEVKREPGMPEFGVVDQLAECMK